MENRDTLLNTILPVITGNQPTDNVNEAFQNEVLRPILKFQNTLLIAYFEQFIVENKIEFHILKHHLKVTKIHDLFKTNIQFKQFYLGLVVALFSQSQFDFYIRDKKELNKRIIAMLIERLCSQIELIK